VLGSCSLSWYIAQSQIITWKGAFEWIKAVDTADCTDGYQYKGSRYEEGKQVHGGASGREPAITLVRLLEAALQASPGKYSQGHASERAPAISLVKFGGAVYASLCKSGQVCGNQQSL
jgi:hypothetical protein